MTSASDLATAVLTLGSVLAGAQRMRLDAVHAAVMLDTIAPRPGCTWRPVCCWCADALDVELGREVEAHRMNRDTGHDTGCCSFCGYGGEDTLVVAVPDDVFNRGLTSVLG